MSSDWARLQTARRGGCRSESGRIPMRRLQSPTERYVAVCDDCGFTVGPTTLRGATAALDSHYPQ